MPRAEGQECSPPATQRCGKCHQHKPLEAFSRNQANPLGRNYRCKECESVRVGEATRRLRQQRRGRPVPEHPPGTLFRCGKCRVEKPPEEFSINRLDVRGRNRRCKECMREYTRNLRLSRAGK
jgi:hypothetical protein